MQKRDKSPIIQVNIMKENISGRSSSFAKKSSQSSKASLNLVKVLANRKSDMNSLWEPSEETSKLQQQSNRFDNYFQRHSISRRSHQSNTSREKIREMSDSPEQYQSNYQCQNHFNKTHLRKRNIQYICCMQKCESHTLCRECKVKLLCCEHQTYIKLDEFLEQPILIFLKKKQNQSQNEDLIQGLILQQMQIYNKVKFQAEQQKQLLSAYFENLQDQLKMKSQAIQLEFSEKIEEQLQKIRKDIDNLVSISLVYKDDFENRLYQNNNLVESIKQFKIQSDDPYEQTISQINLLQQNLNNIPQLSSLVLEQKNDINLKELNYLKLIT